MNVNVARILAALACSVALLSASPAAASSACKSWNLETDFKSGGAAQNPNSDACGNPVWEFLYSPTRTRDPASYVQINWYGPFWHDAGGWQQTSPAYFTDGTVYVPAVALNSSGRELDIPYYAPFPWAAGTTLVHPGPDQPVVVAFHSPVNAHLAVTATFTSLDYYGGDGVDVTVDSLTAARGLEHLLPAPTVATYASPQSYSGLVSVRSGDVVYFTVGPNGNLYYDSTRLQIMISVYDQ